MELSLKKGYASSWLSSTLKWFLVKGGNIPYQGCSLWGVSGHTCGGSLSYIGAEPAVSVSLGTVSFQECAVSIHPYG